MPRVDWAAQPKLETANWPEERRLNAPSAPMPSNICAPCCRPCRSCSAPADARQELGRVARLVGLQFHEETARDMDLPTDVERGDAAERPRLRALAVGGAARPGRGQSRRRRATAPDRAHARLARGARARARRSAKGLRCLERALARRRRGARPVPEGSDHPVARRARLVDRLAYRAEIARRQRMAVDRLAELGERHPARLEMLVAQHDIAARPPARRHRRRCARSVRGSTSNRCSSSAHRPRRRAPPPRAPRVPAPRDDPRPDRAGRPAGPIRRARSAAAARGRRGSGRL